MSTYNLLDIYEITVVDNNINWVEAEEWSPHKEGYDDVEPEAIFTDYLHGKGEIIKDVLVLHPANDQTGDEEDANRFYKELNALPAFHETECFVTDLNTSFPSIRYCRNGNHVPLDYAFYVLDKLGYQWSPDSGRFEKKEAEKSQQKDELKMEDSTNGYN